MREECKALIVMNLDGDEIEKKYGVSVLFNNRVFGKLLEITNSAIYFTGNGNTEEQKARVFSIATDDIKLVYDVTDYGNELGIYWKSEEETVTGERILCEEGERFTKNDLKDKYMNLLNIMKKYCGEEMTFENKEFTGRIISLLCLLDKVGLDESIFEKFLSKDWTKEGYEKIMDELQKLKVITDKETAEEADVPEGLLVQPELERVINELSLLQEDNFYV